MQGFEDYIKKSKVRQITAACKQHGQHMNKETPTKNKTKQTNLETKMGIVYEYFKRQTC